MNWTIVIICAEIFFCRIMDVTLATVRTILTVREKTLYAALIGFLEAFLWFVVVREALTYNGGGLWVALAYAAGFASGTFIGGHVAHAVIRTNNVLQIVTSGKNDELVAAVRDAGFGATVIDVNESKFGGEKYMLFCDIPGKREKELRTLVDRYDKNAFIMVQETKYVYNGFIKK